MNWTNVASAADAVWFLPRFCAMLLCWGGRGVGKGCAFEEKKRSKEMCNAEFAVQAKERALSAMRKSEEGCCASLLNCHIGRCRNINPIKLWLFPLPEWTLPLYMRPIGQRLYSSAAAGWVIWLVAQMIFKARVCKIIHVISYGSDLFEMCDIIPKLRILIAKLNIN